LFELVFTFAHGVEYILAKDKVIVNEVGKTKASPVGDIEASLKVIPIPVAETTIPVPSITVTLSKVVVNVTAVGSITEIISMSTDPRLVLIITGFGVIIL
jgi:hypothetical protein